MTLAADDARATGCCAPDRDRWGDLARSPRRPVHAAIARRLFVSAAARLPVRVILPEGHIVGRGEPDDATLTVHNDAFFHRVGASGLIGFGESYMAGDWDADDLAAALTPFAAKLPTLVPPVLQRLRRMYVATQPHTEDNDIFGARRNIARHYDMSNELFALFLDDTMTYSSALFAAGDSLELAQLRKIDRMLDRAGVHDGTRLLEIGSGWGALAIRAAQRGATVTTLTLSREQQNLARDRIVDAGLADRIDVQLRDYRDVAGTYDAVVSVEMVEAVGDRWWPRYFSAINRVLAPGGRAALQAIVIDHQRYLATRGQYTWIHKYVFPGGLIPSVPAMAAVLREHTELRIADDFRFGDDYARTLHEWRDRFGAASSAVAGLGFDRTFQRMWEFYLAYCEAGFAAGYLDVAQLTLTR